MDCREFRNNHVAFVDDVLCAVDMTTMRQHVEACPRCARHDTLVRRSLLLVRNLPTIQPSADFRPRLDARLRSLGPALDLDHGVPRRNVGLPSLGAFAAIAAALATVGYIALQTTRYFSPQIELARVQRVARAPTPTPAPLTAAAFVASVPTGMPVWPGVLMADEAQMRFASLDLSEGSLAK